MTKTPEQMAEEYGATVERVPIIFYKPEQPCKNAFLAGYQAAKPEWISVNERLPNIGDPCLVTCHEERYAIAEYDGIKWTTLNSIVYYHPIVTHWQELSELPKEEG